MNKCLSRSAVNVFVVAVALAGFQSSPSATHSWGGYHWARQANPFTVKLGDNVSSTWHGNLVSASADWSKSLYGNPLITTVVAGQAKGRNCRPTSGQDEICNAAYGNNGWLGIAQIWITGGEHITQGVVKLNDTYFNTSTYNTPAWRQLVVCQEVGHTFGLDHQNETFNDANLGTCMDYTNDPSGSLYNQADNTRPNKHDYEELALIYSHNDSFNSVSTSAAASRADVDNPSDWGRLMSTTHGGRAQVFERDLGNGERVVTFVIWA